MWFLVLLGLGAAFVAGAAAANNPDQRRLLAAPSEPRLLKPVTPTGPTPEERKAAALKARLQSLRVQHEVFSHYTDPTWLTSYAREHMQWLLENRDDILAECKRLHEQRLDPSYDVDMTYVYEHDQELYNRILWQARVLSIAERLCFEEQEAQSKKVLAEQRAVQAKSVADLFLEYRDFMHYEHDERIEKYASNPRHQQQLLAQREEIIAVDKEFHRDSDFIEALKACAPGIYRRATWRMRALAIADKLSVEPRRLTPEEKKAKILRFRQRMLERLNVKAEDQIALQLQRVELSRVLRERAEALEIDADEVDRLERRLLEDLDDDDEDTGGFKQL